MHSVATKWQQLNAFSRRQLVASECTQSPPTDQQVNAPSRHQLISKWMHSVATKWQQLNAFSRQQLVASECTQSPPTDQQVNALGRHQLTSTASWSRQHINYLPHYNSTFSENVKRAYYFLSQLQCSVWSSTSIFKCTVLQCRYNVYLLQVQILRRITSPCPKICSLVHNILWIGCTVHICEIQMCTVHNTLWTGCTLHICEIQIKILTTHSKLSSKLTEDE